MRRAGHDAGPHKKAGLFERELEGFGLRFRVDEIVFGAARKQHADRIVGISRVADRRGVEIGLTVRHRRRTDEFFNFVVAVAAVLDLQRT